MFELPAAQVSGAWKGLILLGVMLVLLVRATVGALEWALMMDGPILPQVAIWVLFSLGCLCIVVLACWAGSISVPWAKCVAKTFLQRKERQGGEGT